MEEGWEEEIGSNWRECVCVWGGETKRFSGSWKVLQTFKTSCLSSRLKNRHPVKYGQRISAVEEEDGSFCLHIHMVECGDAGYYACKAINEYGTKQCEAKLDIQGTFETRERKG